MDYKKVIITTNDYGCDIVSSIVYDYSSGGLVIEDINDYYDALNKSIYTNKSIAIEFNNCVKVSAYIANEIYNQAIEDIKNQLNNLSGDYGDLSIDISDYNESDNEEWKSFHKPIELDKIIIAPEWYDINSDKAILKIKIGSSFGTGQHETTILAIRMLEQLNLYNKHIIDLGCGSGILGLSALKLGACHAYMCDIEDVSDAIYNADINRVSNKCSIESTDLAHCKANGDIVVSNIYAPILVEYKSIIVSLLNDKGILILSGLYQDGLEQVFSNYSDMRVLEVKQEGDWSAVMLTR